MAKKKQQIIDYDRNYKNITLTTMSHPPHLIKVLTLQFNKIDEKIIINKINKCTQILCFANCREVVFDGSDINDCDIIFNNVKIIKLNNCENIKYAVFNNCKNIDLSSFNINSHIALQEGCENVFASCKVTVDKINISDGIKNIDLSNVSGRSVSVTNCNKVDLYKLSNFTKIVIEDTVKVYCSSSCRIVVLGLYYVKLINLINIDYIERFVTSKCKNYIENTNVIKQLDIKKQNIYFDFLATSSYFK